MARTGKGILSDFSGKVGTVVGSSWKGIAYMRSLPQKKRNRSLTEGQETQHAKFALASRFISRLSQLVTQCYQVENGRTARNSAISMVLTQAIVGVYPNLAIDHSMVLVAKGTLKKPLNAGVAANSPGKLKFTWTNDAGSGNAKPPDKSILVVYDEQSGDVIYTTEGAERSTGEAEIDVPLFSGKTVHTWLAFRSADGKLVADSGYTGVIGVLQGDL